VGRVLLPAAAADVVEFASSLRRGAVMTEQGAAPLAGDTLGPLHLVAVRFTPNADRARAVAGLRKRFGRIVLGSGYDVDVDNLAQIDPLPTVFGVLLGLMAFISIAYALSMTGRRRRRDLALLRTLGFTRGQLAAAVTAQSTTLTAVAGLIGVPVGIVLGRSIWIAVATAVADVDPQPEVPLVALVIGAIAALGLAALLAIRPAARAARLRPGVVLRAE
jgi:hypothetical protein